MNRIPPVIVRSNPTLLPRHSTGAGIVDRGPACARPAAAPRTFAARRIPGTPWICLVAFLSGAISVGRTAETEDARVLWGKEQLQKALTDAGYLDGAIDVAISVDPASPALPEVARHAEGFALRAESTRISVTGFDAAGVLYGCLAAAADVSRRGEIGAGARLAEAPTLALRGPCVLLMKLGSYNYVVSPEEFPSFYDRAQWLRWLDRMAELRFNCLTLWNGHPFAYFVPFDRFPEAQAGMPSGLLERNREMLHWLITEAGRRNIQLVFEFYNIHTSVYFQRAHHLPDEIRTPTPLLRDYTAYAVETFAREFPEVGYHITPGEAIDLEYTDTWVNDVLLPAMERGGRRGPVWLRAWGIDLPHARRVADAHPDIWMERKFNVEMIAGKRADPENRAWAALTGRHVVNIHMAANLEPFRWSPPAYIRDCVQSAIATGATGLHLYPRKSWRWPQGSEPETPVVEWERNWSWYAAWARYAWNPVRDPVADRAWWLNQFRLRFGDEQAADLLLQSIDAGADVLPALQRLIWLGDSNHTVISAGIRLSQLEQAPGIPFLDLPDVAQRIPDFLATLRAGKAPTAPTPPEAIAAQVRSATRAADLARGAAAAATRHRAEISAWARDARAIQLVARFYQEKMNAAVLRASAAAPDTTTKPDAFLAPLERSLQTYRELATFLQSAYDSLSDVPPWHPARLEKVPYHWTDLVPLFERELMVYRQSLQPGAVLSDEPALPGLAGKLFGDPGFKRLAGADPVNSLDLHWSDDSGRGRGWSAEWRGFLLWPRDGKVTLRVRADQAVTIAARGEVVLEATAAGSHDITLAGRRGEAIPLRVAYDHPQGSGSFLVIQWSVPDDGTFAPIPAAALRHSERDAQWVDSAVLLNEL